MVAHGTTTRWESEPCFLSVSKAEPSLRSSSSGAKLLTCWVENTRHCGRVMTRNYMPSIEPCRQARPVVATATGPPGFQDAETHFKGEKTKKKRAPENNTLSVRRVGIISPT